MTLDLVHARQTPGPADPDAQSAAAQLSTGGLSVVGHVVSVGNSGARCRLDGLIDESSLAHRADMPNHVGAHVKIPVGPRWLIGVVQNVRPAAEHPGMIEVDLQFLGEAQRHAGTFGGFSRGISRFPAPGDPVAIVATAELQQIFSADGRATIEVGTVQPSIAVRARLMIDGLLARHFAVLGSSGTGKSTTLALLLHRLIDACPNGHIMMLDPHGEYRGAFPDRGYPIDVGTLDLPYWVMNLREHVELLIGHDDENRAVQIDILSKCLQIARSKSRAAADAGRVTVDSPVPYLMSDLMTALQAQMGKLEKPDKLAPYQLLKNRIEELKNDPRYAFMFSGLLVSDSLGDILARFFRFKDDGKPISIVDLSGVPSDVVKLVVAILCRLAFDFAVWARGELRSPILIICEEAHRYVPAEHIDRANSARRILERIAKEGRKYGVCLGLVTQRPSDLSESVLSQCGTIISMRMNNERDQKFVGGAMPDGGDVLLDALPALKNRECIVSGEGVLVPMRVRLDDLEAERRPTSEDPSFATGWSTPHSMTAVMTDTLRRWRAQSR